jgi:hypothetical protein
MRGVGLVVVSLAVACGGSPVSQPAARREPYGLPKEPLIIEPTPAPAPAPEPAPELVLAGAQHETFEHGRFARICVRDAGRIDVDGSIDIELTSDATTVIGGRGIGPIGTARATVRIRAAGAPRIYVLFDNERAPVDAIIDAPRSQVEVGITGKTGLTLGGGAAGMTTNGGWGLPPSFPTCE